MSSATTAFAAANTQELLWNHKAQSKFDVSEIEAVEHSKASGVPFIVENSGSTSYVKPQSERDECAAWSASRPDPFFAVEPDARPTFGN